MSSPYEEDQCPSCKMVKAIRWDDMTFRLLDRSSGLTEQIDWYACDHCGELFEHKSTFYDEGIHPLDRD